MMRNLHVALAAVVLLGAGGTASAQAPKFLQKTAGQWQDQLNSGQPRARRGAAFALGKLGKFAAAALPELQAMYPKETDASAREAIVLALGEIAGDSDNAGNVPLESLLIDALQRDPDRLVRRSAALALGQIASKRDQVATALRQALSDPEQVVRQNAAWALGQLDAKAAPALVQVLQDASSDSLVKRDAANALFAVGKNQPALMRPALDALLAMCSDPESEVRKAGLMPLVRMITPKDANALPVLKAALRDPDPEVRRFAALALSNMGGANAADAVPILLETLRNGEPNLKQSAAVAMHNIGKYAAAAVPDLIAALKDPDPKLRRNAALALGGIGEAAAEAVPALVKTLSDPNQNGDLRIEAAEALTGMGNIPAVQKQLPAILNVLGNANDDGNLRVRLAWLFNDFIKHAPSMDAAKPVMDKVCSETPLKENGSVRYHCAYLLAFYFKTEAPQSAVNVLTEWLYDDTGRLYGGTLTSAGGKGREGAGAKDDINRKLDGDSRTMAVDVLRLVGRDRVVNNKEIVQQLRRLADDPKTNKELREKCGKLLTVLGV